MALSPLQETIIVSFFYSTALIYTSIWHALSVVWLTNDPISPANLFELFSWKPLQCVRAWAAWVEGWERGLCGSLRAGGDFQRVLQDCKALGGTEVKMGEVLSLEAKGKAPFRLFLDPGAGCVFLRWKDTTSECTCDNACLDSGDFPGPRAPQCQFQNNSSKILCSMFHGFTVHKANLKSVCGIKEQQLFFSCQFIGENPLLIIPGLN